MLQKANVTVPEQLTFVSIDFAKESLADALGRAGFDRLRKTLFVWEGVMYYLPADAVDNTLRFITGNSPAGSTLCFDYLAEAADMLERFGVKESRGAMETTYRAEPVQFRIQEGRIGSFLSDRGFSLLEHLTPDDLEKEFLTLRDGSSAGKVLACFCIVRARVMNGGF
jgi:methyltransferase (TIGR00027 family)